MKSKKRLIIILILVVIILAIVFIATNKKSTKAKIEFVEVPVRPTIGEIFTSVSTTGTVNPENRVEVYPPSTGGRIDVIYVNEGDYVKKGQILALVSSTDRANIIDSASQSDKKYWEEVYKQTQVTAPIAGTIIVRAFEPGQTASAGKAILVISNKLIVKANVDETDIGKIKDGQIAKITLDAYPEVGVMAKVTHIKYESTTVSNVTTYEVQITPDKVPPIFKSGMSASIEVFDKYKKNALLVANSVLTRESGKTYVLVKKGEKTERVAVETGIASSTHTEIVSGITKDSQLVLKQQKLSIPTSESGGNFLFSRPKNNNKK